MVKSRNKVHCAHILVQEAYQAEDLLRKIKEGVDFSVLASQFSLCSSAHRGGDLGLVDEGRLDPDFVEAIDFLKPGEISGVVKTRFGKHIIKLISREKI